MKKETWTEWRINAISDYGDILDSYFFDRKGEALTWWSVKNAHYIDAWKELGAIRFELEKSVSKSEDEELVDRDYLDCIDLTDPRG